MRKKGYVCIIHVTKLPPFFLPSSIPPFLSPTTPLPPLPSLPLFLPFSHSDIVFVFNCPDRHVLCLDCFYQYCDVELQNRQFEEDREAGYTLRCPAKCDGSQIKESHHFRILGKEKVQCTSNRVLTAHTE